MCKKKPGNSAKTAKTWPFWLWTRDQLERLSDNKLKDQVWSRIESRRWWVQTFIILSVTWGNDLICHIFQMGWFNHQLFFSREKGWNFRAVDIFLGWSWGKPEIPGRCPSVLESLSGVKSELLDTPSCLSFVPWYGVRTNCLTTIFCFCFNCISVLWGRRLDSGAWFREHDSTEFLSYYAYMLLAEVKPSSHVTVTTEEPFTWLEKELLQHCHKYYFCRSFPNARVPSLEPCEAINLK